MIVVIGGRAENNPFHLDEVELISVDPDTNPVPSCVPKIPQHRFFTSGAGGYIKRGTMLVIPFAKIYRSISFFVFEENHVLACFTQWPPPPSTATQVTCATYNSEANSWEVRTILWAIVQFCIQNSIQSKQNSLSLNASLHSGESVRSLPTIPISNVTNVNDTMVARKAMIGLTKISPLVIELNML